MEQEQLIAACRDQLKLVLSFFPRVDAKSSVVLAIDTGMLGYLATRLPSIDSLHWWEFISPSLAFAALALSLWHLYKGVIPTLEGGDRSLVYSREIAKRTESRFIDEFTAQQESDYIKDVLSQVWRNSEILTDKFEHLKWSFILMAGAVLPWTIALADFAMRTPAVRNHV